MDEIVVLKLTPGYFSLANFKVISADIKNEVIILRENDMIRLENIGIMDFFLIENMINAEGESVKNGFITKNTKVILLNYFSREYPVNEENKIRIIEFDISVEKSENHDVVKWGGLAMYAFIWQNYCFSKENGSCTFKILNIKTPESDNSGYGRIFGNTSITIHNYF